MVEINWRPSPRELRKFGAVILAGFGLIGALLFWRGHPGTARALWAGAAAVGVLALIWPRGALPFYWVWMGLAFALGSVMSRLVMLLIFYLVITPVAVLFRLRKRDALRLKKGAGSYWQEHPRLDDKADPQHLF